MAIKTIINNTEKEIEQIKNSDEQDVDYVYSRIGDTEVEGEPPISIKSIGGELTDYRIYGNTSKNILPLSKTPKTETIGDILCEYDGKGTFKFTSNVDNPTYTQDQWFWVPFEKDFDFPVGISDGGHGCIQLNNDFATGYGVTPYFVGFGNRDNGEFVSGFNVAGTTLNSVDTNYDVEDLEGLPANCIAFQYLQQIGKRTVTIKPAVYLDISTPLPYEPYGESVGERTGNLFDENIFNKNVADSTITYIPIYVGNIDYVTCSTTCPINIDARYIFILSGRVNRGAGNATNGVSNGAPRTIQPSNGYVTIAYRKIESNNVRPWEYQTMLNVGSTALPYEPYGYKVPVTVEGKNLLNSSLESYTTSTGITVTVNADKSITLNTENVTTADSYIYLYRNNTIPESLLNKPVILSGGTSTASVRWWHYDGTNIITSANSDSDIFTPTQGAIEIFVLKNTVLNNVTVYPMIRKADIEDDTYEPYRTPVTTPIYLPEQIKKVGDEAEYIDFASQKFVKKFYELTLNFDDMNNNETYPGWSGGTAVVKYCNKIRSLATDNPNSYMPIQYSSISNFTAIFNVNSNNSILYLGNSNVIGHTQSELKEIYAGQSITFILKISDTDVDVTLPTLSTVKGTNTLSVGTSIQPSNMYIKDNFDYKKVFTATRTLEDESPLNYKNIEDSDSTLKNYRIYGNTETVERNYSGTSPLDISLQDGTINNYRIYGQTSRNLFESELINYNVGTDGQIKTLTDFILSIAPVIAGTTYTISNNQDTNVYAFYQQYPEPASYSYDNSRQVFNENSITIVAPIDGYIVVRKAASDPPIMLNPGSTALPYEPYGESVGDRTGNLFDEKWLVSNNWYFDKHALKSVNPLSDSRSWSYNNSQFKFELSGGTYTITFIPLISSSTIYSGAVLYDSNSEKICGNSSGYNVSTPHTYTFTLAETTSLGLMFKVYDGAFYIMLNEGSTPLPYGYKVPVTVEGKNLCPYESINNTIIGHVKQGKTYAFSFYALYECGFNLQKRNADSGQTTMFVTRSHINGYVEVTFQADENFDVYFNGYSQTTGKMTIECVSKLQLEEGSEATPYEPYHAPVTIPIYLPEQIRKVGSEVEYIDYAEQKQHRVRKNLFDEKYEGIDDEYDLAQTIIYKSINVGAGVFTLSTDTPQTSEGYCNIFLAPGIVDSGVSTPLNGVSVGNPKTFTSIDGYITIGYRYYHGVNPKLYQTQLERGNTATDYEPYIENTDLDVTLPALPTVTGTNMISVDTSVKPSLITVLSDELVSVGDKVTSGEHTGEYEVPVTVEGKNLYDGEILQGFYNFSNGIYYESFGLYQHYVCTNKIECKSNTTYTIQVYAPEIISYSYGFIWWDENLNFISSYTSTESQSSDITTYTATAPNNAKYMAFDLGANSAESTIAPSNVSWIMLNSGSTPLPYEPYHAPITTPIYLPEQIRKIGDEAEYIDYGEQKQHRVRKNLLPNTATSQTISGVTVTVNSDYSITFNGTASKTIDLHLVQSPFKLPIGKYRLTGAPSDGSVSSYYLRAWYSSSGSTVGSIVWITDSGDGIDFTLTNIANIYSSIVILPGQVLNNVTFYPMIRKADIEDDTYEPYIENTDLDVTLPELPTVTGTNTLSVETEIQPSEVYIKGKIKPVYNPYIFGSLPFTFEAKGLLIRKYEFENNSNNTIGTKTANLVPDLDGWIMGKALSSYGDPQDNKPTLMISDFIEVEPSTAYKFGAVGKVTNEAGTWHRVVYFDENKANISFVDNNYMNTSFTTPATAKYLRLCTTFWYQPFLVKSSDSYTYVPYGYNIPIVLNNTTYQAYLPEPLEKELICENGNNVSSITFINGETFNPAGGTPSEAFVILGPTNNQYTSYGYITYGKATDKYIFGTTGTNTRLISPGTYTMCLTVHNPPSSNTWQISLLVGTYTNGQSYWKPCRCNNENTVNNVATASYTFTIDDTNETQVSFAMLRFDTFNTDATIKEWYLNTKVDINIIEGTEPVFATRTLINNNDEAIPIATMPQLTTVNGSNTIDVNITPKPTGVRLLLN